MKSRLYRIGLIGLCGVLVVMAAVGAPGRKGKPKAAGAKSAKKAKAAKRPENLALRAKAGANSMFSQKYAPRLAIDGVIPAPMGKADIGRVWVVKGATHGNGAQFTLQWAKGVPVAEIVYYGRTGWDWGENWKDYEVYLDAAAKPAAKGRFKAGHGPQRIRLAKPATVKKITLKFLSSYGGPNPGASEIQVYSTSPPAAMLGKFRAPFRVAGRGFTAPPAPKLEESAELAADLKAGKLGFDKLLLIQRHHIRCSHVYTYHCEGQRNGGALVIYDVKDGSTRELVDSTNGQISSCDLSYDGQQILFSWRKRRYYQVYRINVDGTGLTQLTDDLSHNYDACWLPDGDVAFLSSRRPQAAYCFFTPVGIIFRMKPDGSKQRCISSNYLNDFTPAVTNDGKLIYGRWEYVDRPAIPIQSLWTINPDGTALSVFFGNRVLDPATFIEPQPIPGTDKILCTLTGHNGSCRGAIGIIDPTLGNNSQEAIRNLTPEIRLRGVGISSNGPRGPYQTPYPIDQKYFLVSHDGTLLLRDYDRTQQTIVIKPRDGLGFYNPRPLRPRPRPPVRASNLPANAGPWATVYLQDVYRGLEPHVKRGEVKQIAVVQEIERALIDSRGVRAPAFDFQRIVVSAGATYVPKKVWGFVDVDADGSALFRVPAEKPIYFLALDAEGRAVQRMRSFTHLMPGETQGCIGCHEPRTSVSHSRAIASAGLAAAQDIQPPEWGAIGFNYLAIVQPVLDKNCIKCHNPLNKKATKGIDLTGDVTDYFNISYEYLARGHKVGRRRGANEVSWDNPYTKWIPSYNGFEGNIRQIAPKLWGSPASKLTDIILSGHPDENGKPRFKLTSPERRRIIMWMDLNVPYYGTAETAWPTKQACRRQYPANLDKVLGQVAARRCNSCHAAKGKAKAKKRTGGVPRKRWTRVSNPHLNEFLLAPLAKSAGGTEACGKAVFATKDDKDYRAILATFDPVLKGLAANPRMDMPNAKAAPCPGPKEDK